MMVNYTFYDLVEGETHNGQRVYEFTQPCYTMVDRGEVSLTGVRFTLSRKQYPWGDEEIATVIPGSYDLIKPRIGDWHWDNWVFDGGDDLEFIMEYIDAGLPLNLTKSVLSLLRTSGFSVAETGGGCTAWVKEYPNASVLVTGDCGCTHELTPERTENGILVGVIGEDGEPIKTQKAGILDDLPSVLLECIGIAERFRP